MASRRLTPITTLITAVLSVAAFHVAYEWETAAALFSVAYLAGMYRLAWAPSTRWAFYLGLGVGVSIAAPQLGFFYTIFGPAAIGLWLILGLWIATYVLLGRILVARWPHYGALGLPVVWLALEYFRSELYYLRFSWLTPGFSLCHPDSVLLATAGVHGFSFIILLVIALIDVRLPRARWLPTTGAVLLVGGFGFVGFLEETQTTTQHSGPRVVGLQWEAPSLQTLHSSLDDALQAHPEMDILVLSEYTFNGPVPDDVLDWCRQHQRYLIAGGKDPIGNGQQYYNTAFVVSPDGEVVFRQIKSVPVQFMTDGLPAESQAVWDSPWGKIGLAICYDLSYSRVMDGLIEAGAQALIIPTMDSLEWGEHEHRLHAKIAPVRAREYGVPILRVASSGISQLVSAQGIVMDWAPFPGQGELLAGPLPIGEAGSLPVDRYLALAAVIFVAMMLIYLALERLRSRLSQRNLPNEP